MRYSSALALWLLPCALFCEPSPDYEHATTLVRQAVRQLAPPSDAAFDFTQTSRILGHLSRPFKTMQRSVAGSFLLADYGASFYQIDSTTSGKTSYTSFKYCCDTTLAIINYGETEPMKLAASRKEAFVYDLTAYNPIFLLNDFLTHAPESSFLRHVSGPVDSVVYKKNDGNIISLAIDPEGLEVRSIAVTYSHTLYGDVVKTITFDDYRSAEGGDFRYPAKIVVSELGFDASVVAATLVKSGFDKARITGMIPADYALQPERPEPPAEISSSAYTPHLHFIDLKHADSRVLLVEFKEYLLVAEAPLTTENGEMIISRARQIAPGKPIRYFVFGHHHPHYIGGIRAFVHDGATILTTPLDSAYVTQLASSRRQLQPDVLAREPRPLKLDLFEREKTISDGDLEMRIIHIGEMSQHTDDYLIYYFPKYKLLFQGDLAGIKKDGPLQAANSRQKGLYDAITLHGLDVETVVQGWPLHNYGVKSVFGFDELRRSVEMMEGENK